MKRLRYIGFLISILALLVVAPNASAQTENTALPAGKYMLTIKAWLIHQQRVPIPIEHQLVVTVSRNAANIQIKTDTSSTSVAGYIGHGAQSALWLNIELNGSNNFVSF